MIKHGLNRSNLIFFFWAIFSLVILTAVSPGAATSVPQITYNIEVNENSWRSLNISISIQNNSDQKLLCVLPGCTLAECGELQSNIKISNFNVVGESEQDPTFIQTSETSWLIDCRNNNVIFISYSVSQLIDPLLGPSIGRNFALINGSTVLMYIRELKNFPLKLAVSVPYEWKLATCLEVAGEDFQYSAQNYDDLVSNPLFLGTFEDIYFTHQDQMHFNIFIGPRKASVEKLSLICKKVLAYQSELFNERLVNSYLFIFRFFPEKRELVSQAYSNALILNLSSYNLNDNIKKIGKKVGSDFFKRWMQPPSLKEPAFLFDSRRTQNLWFWAGLAEYFGSLTMVRQKIWEEDDFLLHYLAQINQLLKATEFQQYPVSKLICQTSQFAKKDVVDYVRLKGEILCLLLDLKIREQSQHKKSLDDVARFIYDWYISRQTSFNNDDVLPIINSVAAVDLTTFFDLYVDGKIQLPLAETLNLAGLAVEFVKDTVANLGELKLGKNNKVDQLESENPLAQIGIKAGDKLVSLDNSRISNQYELETIIDTLKVRKEIEVMVEREGLSLLYLLTVPGREVAQLKLVNIEKQLEPQVAFRKKWIYGIE